MVLYKIIATKDVFAKTTSLTVIIELTGIIPVGEQRL